MLITLLFRIIFSTGSELCRVEGEATGAINNFLIWFTFNIKIKFTLGHLISTLCDLKVRTVFVITTYWFSLADNKLYFKFYSYILKIYK